MTDDATPTRDGGNNPGSDGAGDDPSPPHDAVGAFVLDALPEPERAAFVGHAAGCGACRRSVAELASVAALLPRLLEVAPEYEGWVAGGNGAAGAPRPGAGLRERLLVAARAEREAGPGTTSATVPADAPWDAKTTATAPRDRPIGPGPVPAPPIPFRAKARFGGGWPVAAALTLVAAGSIAWGVAMQGRVADREADLAAREGEIATVRAGAARAIALAPTGGGPDGAWGDLLYDPAEDRAMLHVGGLPPLPENRTYQLWMMEGKEPVPSETFGVDPAGEWTMAMEADLSAYDAVALTEEPASGSRSPTSAPILLARLGTN